MEYATLTDIIYQAWSGKTAREYKKFKGLKKENLRDNMTNEELVLNMLAELSTTSITRNENPTTMDENKDVAASLPLAPGASLKVRNPHCLLTKINPKKSKTNTKLWKEQQFKRLATKYPPTLKE